MCSRTWPQFYFLGKSVYWNWVNARPVKLHRLFCGFPIESPAIFPVFNEADLGRQKSLIFFHLTVISKKNVCFDDFLYFYRKCFMENWSKYRIRHSPVFLHPTRQTRLCKRRVINPFLTLSNRCNVWRIWPPRASFFRVTYCKTIFALKVEFIKVWTGFFTLSCLVGWLLKVGERALTFSSSSWDFY